jgi:circadian clock protein KaiC
VKKLRGVNFVGGYHEMNIQRGGIVVYPRLIASEHLGPMNVVPFTSGIAELDALSGGGLHFGTTTLITGPAGTGKSLIATRYFLTASERGLKPAYFAFDEVKSTILARAKGVGMDLSGCLDSNKCTLRQVDPAELMPGEFSGAVRAAITDGAKLVVIDSLNGFYQSMPEERFLNAHMHELLAYLNQQGVLTLLVLTQQGMFSSNVPVVVDLSYLADAILLLRYFEFAGKIRQAISVVKKRTGRHERTLREFEITGEGLHIGDPLSQFHGVLTGTPQFFGDSDKMLSRQ